MAAAGLQASQSLENLVPALPNIPERSFKLGDFGALGDGKTDNSRAFQRAIEAVRKAGGGTLVVPAGRWVTGPLDLCAKMNLQLEEGATLAFLAEQKLYTLNTGKYRPLLRASKADDVAITGTGTIDGNGSTWWEEAIRFKQEARAKGAKSDTNPRPNMVGFERCERVLVQGVTLTNSPKFNLVPSNCTDVTVVGIKILNPKTSPNTDGIDPSLTHRMLISKCLIDTGDDNIALKAGGPAGEGIRDLLVTDCVFKAGHGCSFGSEMSGSVSNVLVRRCSFEGTDIGVRFKSDRSRGGLVENVVYTDLTMKNVGHPIVITSYYPASTQPKPGQKVEAKPRTATTPVWRSITVRNLSATGSTNGAGLLLGLPESPITDLTLENISIEAPVGLRLAYVKKATLRNVKIVPAKGEALLVEEAVEDLNRID